MLGYSCTNWNWFVLKSKKMYRTFNDQKNVKLVINKAKCFKPTVVNKLSCTPVNVKITPKIGIKNKDASTHIFNRCTKIFL